MSWPPPTPEEQVLFLRNLQRLLVEGQFVASYKFALLHAMADLCVLQGDDSGSPWSWRSVTSPSSSSDCTGDSRGRSRSAVRAVGLLAAEHGQSGGGHSEIIRAQRSVAVPSSGCSRPLRTSVLPLHVQSVARDSLSTGTSTTAPSCFCRETLPAFMDSSAAVTANFPWSSNHIRRSYFGVWKSGTSSCDASAK